MQMSRPRILGETRHEPVERPPPREASLGPHPWLAEDSTVLYERAMSQGRPLRAYLSDTAERKIREHAADHAVERLEVMGFLLGEVRTWNGAKYVLVRDTVTTGLRSSSSKVRFDPSAFPKLFAELDSQGFDYILVGWYHSHPGHTCFLSRTDIETQRKFFSEPYHVALVVDPVNEEARTFRLDGDGYSEVPFAVYPASEDPLVARPGTRSRRLKARPPA
jgi:proteasome lid subunit RPN8/RPN11